jgi:glutathione synthase/RimK-type ligase-like ATP-grasp enzyme
MGVVFRPLSAHRARVTTPDISAPAAAAIATIAIVTYYKAPNLTPDDALVVEPLAARGVRVVPVQWTDESADWSAFDAVVLRSCWEYYREEERFLAWLDRLDAAGVPVWNSTATVRWNARKTYLVELAERGVRTIPSEHVPRGAQVSLADIRRRTGWGELVVKPVVSGGAFETWRVPAVTTEEDERRFAEFISARDTIVQPFLPEIGEGEWSFIFFLGELSHAVRKRPVTGDFRVQPQYGGVTTKETPRAELVAQAAAVLAAAPEGVERAPLYARVDACEVGGELLLMELEIIEPQLFFVCDPESPARFADAVVRALDSVGVRAA